MVTQYNIGQFKSANFKHLDFSAVIPLKLVKIRLHLEARLYNSILLRKFKGKYSLGVDFTNVQ